MPELPEVETVRQSLITNVINEEIVDVDILYPRVLRKIEAFDFAKKIIGTQILDIRRRGKYLLFALANGYWMIIHLRMTGRLLFFANNHEEIEKHTSVIFSFFNKTQMRFVDQRKFGTINLVSEKEISELDGLRTMGPEPLSDIFTPHKLEKIVQKSTGPIKSILLNQKRIAGLGNIYADESLFEAGIHPLRSGASLSVEEITNLYFAIRNVLTEAIKYQGTTIKDYRTGYGDQGEFQNRLKVYGKTGGKCSDCAQLIEKIRVAGRSSHFCPNCQKEEKK